MPAQSDLNNKRESTHKGVNQHSQGITQAQQQRQELLTVTLTRHACKYKVHELHQWYILKLTRDSPSRELGPLSAGHVLPNAVGVNYGAALAPTDLGGGDAHGGGRLQCGGLLHQLLLPIDGAQQNGALGQGLAGRGGHAAAGGGHALHQDLTLRAPQVDQVEAGLGLGHPAVVGCTHRHPPTLRT